LVAHKDRFSRLGFDLFESIFERFGAALRVVDSSVSPDEDLARDIIEIITVFTARYHGRRSYIDESKVLSESDSEDVHSESIGRVKKALQ
jgi:predicted site-specific integrase-resolvase